MSADIGKCIGRRVSVMTTDGRHLLGVLRGADQLLNLVLDDAADVMYDADQAAEVVPCGAMVLRGDSVMAVGAVDTAAEAAFDRAAIRFGGLPVTV
jgi:U6 snRNA-associated Sm-like protein LSm8